MLTGHIVVFVIFCLATYYLPSKERMFISYVQLLLPGILISAAMTSCWRVAARDKNTHEAELAPPSSIRN
jgi:hypothetical protein